MKTTEQIKLYIKTKLDMEFVGVAAAGALSGEPEGHRPEDILPGAKSIVVFGRKLAEGAVQTLFRTYEDNITQARSGYAAYCAELAPNILMVDATFAVASYLEDTYKTVAAPLPFNVMQSMVYEKYPAPYFTDPYGQGMPLNIYQAAMAAGLGEYGWSNRFLTPEFGPRVVLSAVLTTMELEPDAPYSGERLCDPAKCGICSKMCPTCAIPAPGTKAVTKSVKGRNVEVAAIKPTSCAVASLGFRKGYHPRAKETVDTNDPTPEQLAEAVPKLALMVEASVNHYPRDLCERCLIYCPVGHWKEKFEDTGFSSINK